ncbi:MAG: hypothetical protein ABI234_05955 [Ktedonobacteraceae bacterium]
MYDNAGVLDVSSVHNAASNLPYALDVYTSSTFTGTKTEFDRTTIGHLNSNPNLIVLAIDTTHRHMYVAHGSKVPLSNSGVDQTVSAFSSRFGNGNYTGATVAAINSMQQSLSSSGGASGSSGTLLWIGLLLLGIILVAFLVMRRRISGAGRSNVPYQQPMYPSNQGNYYGQPNNQGNYYGQPNNQGGGMNPWAAGGLGAAAGGLVGYELGKEAGEGERNNWGDGGGNFGGGGGGGDFGGGGGGGGDFGGGGGGGGDFGGGGGGGGDFGGGGGGGGGGDF